MNKILLFIVFLLPGFSRQEKHHPPHWSYEGTTGPEHWSDLTPEYSTCKTGREQSPVNISKSSVAHLPPIDFNYTEMALKIINNGHTVQVNCDGHSFIKVGTRQYRLLQFHFHHPSEEQIKGKTHQMVIHFVHQDMEGHKAVVAVLADVRESNPVIKAILDNLPAAMNQEVTAGTALNPEGLLPPVRSYYTFSGSLTTPPCSEGVTWFVLKQTITLSPAELARIAQLYRNNARPVQPLNGRVVLSTR